MRAAQPAIGGAGAENAALLAAQIIALGDRALANKLEMVARSESLMRNLMIEGIVAIQSGEKPQLIKEKLKGFLAPSTREAVDAEA